MLFDSHVHTEFSVDGKAELKEYLKAASEQKIGITITDHIDYINPRNYDSQPSLFDCEKLFDSFLPFSCDNFRIGVELGMEPSVAEKNCNLVKSQPWDYVLGSMHIVGGAPYAELVYSVNDIPKIYSQYFAEYAGALRLHECVDAVAHIDGICRYNKYPDNNLTLANCGDGLYELLKLMVTRELALEINTERFDITGATDSLLTIVRLFRALGGKYFTAGSDAHRVGRLGYKLRQAYDLGDSAGLRAVTFCERKPEFIKRSYY
ncbi:MAG: histidinol-phosphatase HisJ family protein [Negativicutes bacterium]